MGKIIVSGSAHRPLRFIGILIIKLNVNTSASTGKGFLVARIPPNVCHLRTSFLKCGARLAPRCQMGRIAPCMRVRLRRRGTSLGRIIIATSPFRGMPRDPIDLQIVNLRRVRGTPNTGQSVSGIMRGCPKMTFSPVNCHGSLVIQKNNPSRGHFCLSKMRVPGVGRFDARKTSKNPIKLVSTSLVHDIGFCDKTFPTSGNGTLDDMLSFDLHSKSVRHGSLGTALNTSRISLDSGKRVNGGASCLISMHRSCLRTLFGVLNLPFLPTCASTSFGVGAHFSDRGRLALLNLKKVSHVGLGLKVRNRSTRCVLDCLPRVGRRACAMKNICHRCSRQRIRSVMLDRDCLGGHGMGCHSGSRDDRRGLALQLNSVRRRAGLHVRGASS